MRPLLTTDQKEHDLKKIICIILAMMVLAGCGKKPVQAPATEETLPPVTEETVPEEPVYTPVMTADGKSASLGCKAVYEEGEPSDAVIATMGEASLTGKQLQAYYSLIVNGWRHNPGQNSPDFAVPLYAQSCPQDAVEMSWEQYFLSRALRTWQLSTMLRKGSRTVQKADDPDYTPNMQQHGEHLPAGYPVYQTMYGDRDVYEMPPMHTRWIESLNSRISDGDVLQAARELNEAYSYFDALWERSRKGLSGTRAGQATVDLRQCLLLPEGAQVAADGRVTASEESWQAAMSRGQQLLEQWQAQYATHRHGEATFAAMANQNSRDSGTAVDGGSLNRITRGMLIGVLDDWCFDEARQVGDYACLRSEYGVILTYLCGKSSEQENRQAADRFDEAMLARLDELSTEPMQVDYSAICLAPVEDGVGFDEVLYPDVGHERYSYVPTYFQQDYYTVPYGPYTMHINGCGITSLAMLATYMSDEFTSPAVMARAYGEYSTAGGSNADMYVQVTPELDFYFEQLVFDWNVAREALAQGKKVISLQSRGYFTTGGHFILLAGLTEDGRVIVRDPSLNHYEKLKGFAEDCFDEKLVYQGGGMYWIFQEKILTIPGCSRCGDGSCYAVGTDYLCRKCQVAAARRESFTLQTAGIF